jgi:hypothetical protein
MKRIDGEPVSNAAMPLRLKITDDDISRGKRGQPNACAIAVAAMHRVKGCSAAQIHRSCAYLNINGKWRRYHISSALWAEIIAFDRGGKFWAGEHDLSPPPMPDIMPAKRKRSTTTSSKGGSYTKSGHKRRKPHQIPGLRETAQRNEPAISTKGE